MLKSLVKVALLEVSGVNEVVAGSRRGEYNSCSIAGNCDREFLSAEKKVFVACLCPYWRDFIGYCCHLFRFFLSLSFRDREIISPRVS